MVRQSLASALLRRLDAFDARRAAAYRAIGAALTVLIVAAWFATARTGIDLSGKPLGTDFVSFWSAARLAIADGAAAYDGARHEALQQARFGAGHGYFAFFYPPAFLMLCAPLGLLPYLPALAIWLGATGLGYAAVVRRWLGSNWRSTALTIAAFPPVLLNIGHGQNGFLTTALLGGGLLAMRSRPLVAGMLLGALVVKPHLAVLLPVALTLRGEWRTFLATGAAASGWCLLSLALFGVEAWGAFLANADIARATLEQGLVSPAKMVSLFAALRVAGADLATAYAAQAAGATVAVLAVALAARQRFARDGQDAILIAATLGVSPFLLDYDLTLMALPLAWWLREALRRNFLDYEKAAMLALFVAPLVLRPLAAAASLPLAPLVTIVLLWGCWRAAATASPCRHSHAASAR